MMHGNIGPTQIRTPKIRRHVDDELAEYDIYFSNNRQTNAVSGYARNMSRRAVEIANITSQWYFRDESQRWVVYDTLTQGIIEQHYTNYRNGRGASVQTVEFAGRPEKYDINFVSGTQKNMNFNTVRPIKRI